MVKVSHVGVYRLPKKGSTRARSRRKRKAIAKRNEITNTKTVVPHSNMIISKKVVDFLANICAFHGSICAGCEIEIIEKKGHFMQAQCKCCSEVFSIDLPDENQLTTNQCFIWGMYMSGMHYEQLKNFLTVMEVECLSFYEYQKLEKNMLETFKQIAMDIMKENGKEEHRLAMEAEEYVIIEENKVPYITVVVDGSWSKRTYGHSYNANGGMAVIIGERTKKVLWIGTRQRTCQVCARFSSKTTNNCLSPNNESQTEVKNHDCQINWSQSSTSMESDLIVEGFSVSRSMHGLMYKNMIADGDSSVYSNVINQIRYPNILIRKIECVNHAVKCLNSSLYKIVSNTKFSKENRDMLSSRLERFGRAARSAIVYNHKHQNDSIKTNHSTLRADLDNMPLHIFGQHQNCKSYFCERKQEENFTVSMKQTEIWKEIINACTLIANKSPRLIDNKTSNLAESFMSHICKYLQGKRMNITQKYGYKIRIYASLFSYEKGSFWLTDIYQRATNAQSPPLWTARTEALKRKCENLNKWKSTSKNKVVSQKQSKRVKINGDIHYGPHAIETDVDQERLNELATKRLRDLDVTVNEQIQLEMETRDQLSDAWYLARRDRITASKAGVIYTMRDSTNNSNLMKQLLYSEKGNILSENDPRTRGLRLEPVARSKYESTYQCKVQNCGLYVSVENGIFAASPDGIVEEKGIIEIKCTNVPAKDIPYRKTDRFLSTINGTLRLKRNHKYFYQVATQLFCTKRDWCDFIVYYQNEHDDTIPVDIWKERIFSSETMLIWNEMLPKLTIFFMEDMLPEIVDSRFKRNLLIRQPEYRASAIQKFKEKKENAAQRSKQKNILKSS